MTGDPSPLVTDPLEASLRQIAREHASSPEAAPETGHLSRQSLAAHRFVEAAGAEVRFDHTERTWFIWTGHRWRRDQTGTVTRRWLDVLAARYQDALTRSDENQRRLEVAAVQSAGATDAAIVGGLRIAATLEPVAVSGDVWDRQGYLLGCENGVVDLRTGVLRDGVPEDLITRSTGLDYDPDARCPRWERFLQEVFRGDQELVEWFQRLVGASLVGTSKELVAIHHGRGNNGKSVGFRTLRLAVGDYATDIAVETLLGGRRDSSAATPDLMRLRGARLVFTSEPNRDARLNGGQLKRLSTIDRLSGRELHRGQQEWDPTHTVHLATNHLPDIDDTSEGAWRRLALVPWMEQFRKAGETAAGPREDPSLAGTLALEVQGILAWVVRGAVAYACTGTLHPFPAAVVEETLAYRRETDPFESFCADLLEPAEGTLTGAAIFAAYLDWAAREGIPPARRLDGRSFGKELLARHQTLGFPMVPSTRAGRRTYRGVGLRAHREHGEGGEVGPASPVARGSRT